MQEPSVAIWMLTYNHEKYIAQAIESVVTQITNFPYKIYLGEDCSKDNTRNICIEYEKKYPDKIKLYLNEKNDHKKNGKTIYDAVFNSGAKYIAMLEGDDYWTDPLKLQKQVDFLEANKSVVISSHNSNILLKNGVTYLYNKDKKYTTGPYESVYKLQDYIIRDFFHTSSILFRRSAFKGFPDWFKDAFGGDYFLVLLLAINGDIHYINESLSVYRIHGNSISDHFSRHEIAENFDLHFKKYDKYSNFRYHKVLEKKAFSFWYNFYYYHSSYRKKLGFFISNFPSILKISTSVISPFARFKILIPTYFLKSKVNLFTKKEG